MLRMLSIMSLLPSLGGCVGIPANVTAVKDFNAKKYEGTWYEIARLENSFEKDLERVTALTVPDCGCSLTPFLSEQRA
jgi:apolipoprotein D and lipocalin family protein